MPDIHFLEHKRRTTRMRCVELVMEHMPSGTNAGAVVNVANYLAQYILTGDIGEDDADYE
jgi:hypothetical protein